MTGWRLSVDVGTTSTAAAIDVDGHHRPVELDGHSNMPSTVLAPASGPLVVGRAARSQAVLDPDRVEHTPKRRLGDPVLLLGDRAVEPVDAVAAILQHVADAASATMGGTRPDRLVLTHPVRWGSARLVQLAEAAQRAGLPAPELVSEPVAAAAHVAPELTRPGDLLAVYDLGGGTFDAAVVRRTEEGFVVSGPPGGDETIGGEVFDDLLVDDLLRGLEGATAGQVRSSPDRAWRQAGAGLRQSARTAKEALSTSESYAWYVGPPIDRELSLTRARLDELIHGPVVATIHSLVDAVGRSGLSPQDLTGVVMVGGCARSPLVGRLLTEAIGRPPLTWGDPKAAVSLGALSAVQDEQARPTTSRGTTPGAPASEPPAEAEATDVADEPPAEHDPSPAPPPAPPSRPEPDSATSPDRAPKGWDRARIGTFVAVLLVLLGVVSAVVAYLLS